MGGILVIKYEFVASAMSFVLAPHTFHKNQMSVDAYRKFFPFIAKEFPDQRFSILFNAYMEQNDGVMWRKYFSHDEVKLYADSGGLQMITLGKEVTPQIKDTIYDVQGSTSDYAMIFDEIPAIKMNEGTLNHTTNRLFDADKFEQCAKETAANVKRQLDVFDTMQTKTKPLLILQGNDTSWYQRWLDICLTELGPDYYNRLSGLAFGTPVYGNGIIEDIERMFWVKDIEAPEHLKNHIHLLGVGSINRFVVCNIMRYSGALPDSVHLSYDSSKLTGGTRRGEYHFNHQVTRFWRDDPVGLDKYVGAIEDLCRKIDVEFCEAHLRSSVLHSQTIRLAHEDKAFDYERLNLAYVQSFLMSAYGFMHTLEHFKERKNIETECKNRQLLKLLDITDNQMLNDWKKEASRVLKSDKVQSKSSYVPPSSLQEFF